MIGVSKLLCGSENFGDKLRYVSGASNQRNGVSTCNIILRRRTIT